jgi:DNA-binding CsgD family transcriptional regulator
MQVNDLIKTVINNSFIKQIPGFFGILSLKSDFLLVNDNGSNWIGFTSPDSMMGLSYRDMRCKAAEHADFFVSLDEKVKIQGKMRFLGHYCYANNEWKIILGEKYLIKDNENKAVAIATQFNDFTHSNLIDISRFLINNAKKYSYKISKEQFFYEVVDSYTNYKLTERQAVCMFFILRGKTMKEIANLLHLSPRTIEHHFEQIKVKLGCFNKNDLVEKGILEGYMNILPSSLLSEGIF